VAVSNLATVKAPQGSVPAGGYLAHVNLSGTSTTCVDKASGQFRVAWVFAVDSDTTGGFTVTPTAASAGGISGAKTQPASAGYTGYHALTWTSTGTCTGAVTQTVTFNTVVNAASGSPTVSTAGRSISLAVKSPC
jgi:hypothetical protein